MRSRFWIPMVTACVLGTSLHAQFRERDEGESLSSSGKAPADHVDAKRTANIVIEKTNEFRKTQGRQPVKVNEKLQAAAQYFADFMAKNDKYGHTADGKRPSERAKNHGYDYCIIAENIAYEYNSAGFSTEKLADAFFEGWKHSPEHRKNMLDPDVTETGVAIARSSDSGYYYAVQEFGRPKSMAIEFVIENKSDTEVEYKIGDHTYPLQPRLIRTHTVCRPEKVQFESESGGKELETIQPSNGDRFAVTKVNGTIRIKKE